MIRKALFFCILIFVTLPIFAQQTDTIFNPDVYYSSPKTYILKDVKVKGVKYLEPEHLLTLSGLKVGSEIEIPGKKITKAVNKLWKQGLFSNIKVSFDKVYKNEAYLSITLQERPRLSKVNYIGSTKSETNKIKEKLNLVPGNQINDNVLSRAKSIIENFYKEKGFYSTDIKIAHKDDPEKENNVIVDININRKKKIKISDIFIEGNVLVKSNKLKRAMKKTKEKKLRNFFHSAKYVEANFEDDKIKLIDKYNELGFRDALILSDTVYKTEENRVAIKLKVHEGPRYYFRNIKWVGNTVYTDYELNRGLRIRKGDVFNQTDLDKRLSQDEDAVSNLYLDRGYLFFNARPVEALIENDSIDIEIRLTEGKQATINRVDIVGNDKTNDHVARRELLTYPGDLFSKTKLMDSYRRLAGLGHFNPETIKPDVKPDPENGTVDIEYQLEEKANDQIELSGGWGGGMVIGSIGLKFTNFSIRNIFNKEAWRPLPTGDGQTLSLRAQQSGKYQSSFSFSFVEPWLGGKKPQSLSISLYNSKTTQDYYNNQYSNSMYNNSYNYGYNYGYGNYDAASEDQYMKVWGVSVGLGQRLKWPDYNFVLQTSAAFQQYEMKNWTRFIFDNGNSNNINFSISLSRDSRDNPLYTRYGSMYSLSVEFTPPFSWFDGVDYSKYLGSQADLDNLTNPVSKDEWKPGVSQSTDSDNKERYKWLEYHKWNFIGRHFVPLSKNNKLVLYTGMEFGFLGNYDKNRQSPFEGFYMGGDGMAGGYTYGTQLISLRGYQNNSIMSGAGNRMGSIYEKFVAEIRYPLSLAQSATIYALAFAEAGNAWTNSDYYRAFELKRSVGVGLRIFLPMFGLMGLDWGYGLDHPVLPNGKANGGEFHFMLGKQF